MQQKFDETSEKIIKATLGVVQREGIEKATTKKIAAEAGFNELTIFRKFENKKNLIEATKEYHLQTLLDKLEDVFYFEEDDEIEGFLRISFFGILNLEEEDFNILKVAMEEVRGDSESDNLISQVTDLILGKLEEFFKLQINKGIIKDLNTKSLAVICYNMLFQSVILWKIYGINLGFETNLYLDDILGIFFEGITI